MKAFNENLDKIFFRPFKDFHSNLIFDVNKLTVNVIFMEIINSKKS